MATIELTKLIEAGAHFGHLTRRWNPKMKKYIFMEKKGIHIIDLKKTQEQIDIVLKAIYDIVANGDRVLFVGTKKQAKYAIADEAKRANMNWVSERWLGGMLTNYSTIRKSIKRLHDIDKMESDGTFEKLTKKEALIRSRERDKLRKVLNGIETMGGRLPGAVFVVDIKKESIAVKEAKRLNIPTFAIVDTNCDPNEVDYAIPANDDAVKTVRLITSAIADIIEEANVKAQELKAHKAAEEERQKKERAEKSEEGGKVRRRRFKTDNKKRPKKDSSEKKEAESKEETPKAEAAKKEEPKTDKAENKESENKKEE